RGALTLSRRGADFVIESARPKNFDRPWSPAPVPRQARAATFGESSQAEIGGRARDATLRQEDIEAEEEITVTPEAAANGSGPKRPARMIRGPQRAMVQLWRRSRNRPSLTVGVKRKDPWRSPGDCCQGSRSVCVRGAELLPCVLADKNAVGHRLK